MGTTRNYDVSFVQDGARPPMAVIAGEIATGKTSILEFIAFCLGGSSHPQHPEIQRQAQAALLEIELDKEVLVIERALFSAQNLAWAHHTSLAELGVPHPRSRHVIDPPSSDESLSTFLLEPLGLAGIELKEAPTKADSPTQVLSIRNLLWLAYLTDDRIGTDHLLFEGAWVKNLRLQQVIEVMFGVHDEQLAKLGAQLDRLRDSRQKEQAALAALRAFLDEQQIVGPLELAQQEEELTRREASAREELSRVELDMHAAADHAQVQRATYASAREEANEAASAMRYHTTLLTRLVPLRGQYAEDERKLLFYSEAKTLFDPLEVTTCPSCQQQLSSPVRIDDGVCSLCHQVVPTGDEALDFKGEIDAVRRRRRELEQYLGEVERELSAAERRRNELTAAEETARQSLDAAVAVQLSPYVARRDEAVRAVERIRADLAESQRRRAWWDAVDKREIRVLRLTEQIDDLRKRIDEMSEDRPSRESLISELSARFEAILNDFGFPKLYDGGRPHLDARFTPVVRGMPYNEIGSKGAKSLTAVAWALSIYELALERDAPHPGFLMIDSPQQGLRPEAAGLVDEFAHEEIGERVWERLVQAATETPRDPQMIVVDNVPRSAGQPHTIVDYTGERGHPPYGLIENEEGGS